MYIKFYVVFFVYALGSTKPSKISATSTGLSSNGELKVSLLPSYFINNSVNLTIVGLRGCQLWIINWSMNILIWAMNIELLSHRSIGTLKLSWSTVWCPTKAEEVKAAHRSNMLFQDSVLGTMVGNPSELYHLHVVIICFVYLMLSSVCTCPVFMAGTEHKIGLLHNLAMYA